MLKPFSPKYWVETIGTEVQWTFYLNLPTQASLPHWFCGVLWEFHTNTSSGHNLAIDVTSTPQPCFKIMRDTGGGPKPDYTFLPSPSTTGTRSSCRSNGRWDRTAIYGGLLTARNGWDYSGATCFPGDGDPYLQFGYYSSTGAGTNYSQFGGITKRPSSNS